MRIEIQSNDRIGISQEILSAFSKQEWNLKGVEVTTCFTYVHIENTAVTLSIISDCLAHISGIISIKEIAFLPIEQRENHLQILLDRLPDPIIDLDHQGTILAVNSATKKLLAESGADIDLLGQSIDKFIEQDVKQVLTDKVSTQSLSFNGKTFLADVRPVVSSHQQLTGLMITLRSMKTVGRQLSLMQSHQEHDFNTIIGDSAAIQLIKSQGERFAMLDLPVLISGETGTGKELIARALHQKSHRAKSPFLAVNCAALPEHLLESELFGYSAGAFTGAKKSGKPGLIELAEGGSIFLDEIAEMSIYLQAKILRFLQDFSYRRVGGTKELHANVRIISASHQNLTQRIESQLFREDLFYRLNVLNIELPPLRKRSEDIVLLALHFIENASIQVNQSSEHVIKKLSLTEEALTILKAYSWPGNIRQLQNVLFSVVALSEHDSLDANDVTQALAKFPGDNKIKNKNIMNDLHTNWQNMDWAEAQEDFEEKLLRQLYPLFPTTRKLADRLKVSHNKIAMKLRRYNINS